LLQPLPKCRRSARMNAEFSDFTNAEVIRAQRDSMPRGLARWKIKKVVSYLNSNLDTPLRVADLARVAGLSSSHFCRAFKQALRITPYLYVMRTRVERAQRLLRASDAPAVEISASCGFADQSHFTRLFKRFVGAAPGAWRRSRPYIPESRRTPESRVISISETYQHQLLETRRKVGAAHKR
jgi:transcriptional regulator GlxA family with amidase domain